MNDKQADAIQQLKTISGMMDCINIQKYKGKDKLTIIERVQVWKRKYNELLEIACLLPGVVQCASCKKHIDKKLTVCPHCQAGE
jgi:hypothetical protein